MFAGATQEIHVRRPRDRRQAVVNLPTQGANWGAHALAGKGRVEVLRFPDLLCGNVGPTEHNGEIYQFKTVFGPGQIKRVCWQDTAPGCQSVTPALSNLLRVPLLIKS